MLVTSFAFFIFLFLTIVIFYLIPKKFKWIFLLCTSLYFLFYHSFNLKTIVYVLIILLTSYICAILIDKCNEKNSKRILILGIIIILGELIFLKYTNLILVTVNHLNNLFGINKQFKLVYHESPVGLSYYSLIMISYMVDVYRKICKPQKNILKCALFMSYFPILTSGPFVRYNDMEEKLYGEHKFNLENLYYGIIRLLWGLFKILVISQRLGIFVDSVYSNVSVYNGFYIILAAGFFTLQLFTNFSGSIDVIMGASKMLGIELPENFTSPFFSETITELWRNWHITLGAWLKDYVFYPLMKSDIIQNLGAFTKKIFGKKVSKKVVLYISMFIMWVLIGAWHNGAYTFIISSGILQFIYIFCEDIFGPLVSKINKKLGINEDAFSYHLYRRIRTFLLFSFALIFFRSTSVGNAFLTIKNIFVWNPWVLTDNTSIFTLGLDVIEFRILILSLISLFIIESMKRKGNVITKLREQNIVFRWGIIYLLIFSIIIFGMYGPGYDAATFIYRGF